jgi:hypothetical protein
MAALASPALAQDAPIVVDPPLRSPVAVPAGDAERPNVPSPPAIVPSEDAVSAPTEAAPPIPRVWSPVPTDDRGRSAYGLYLAGRLAGIRGDRAESAELLARSQALAPEQPTIAEEAFRTSLFTGDLETVARLTPQVRDTPLLAEAGRLFEIVLAMKADHADVALAALRERPFAVPYASAAR